MQSGEDPKLGILRRAGRDCPANRLLMLTHPGRIAHLATTGAADHGHHPGHRSIRLLVAWLSAYGLIALRTTCQDIKTTMTTSGTLLHLPLLLGMSSCENCVLRSRLKLHWC